MRRVMKKMVFLALFAVLMLMACGKKPKMPGYYTLSGITIDGESLSRREIRDLNCYIVLEKEGTGWLVYGRDVDDVKWDEKNITTVSDREKMPYTLDGDELTVGDPDEIEFVFTRSSEAAPDKPEPLPDISDKAGRYVMVSKDGEPAAEYEGAITIYDDYTALLDTGDFYDIVEFDLDRRDITFRDVDGEDCEGSLKNGVIDVEIDGVEYVFAMEDTDTYAQWQEDLASASGSLTGYYTLSRITSDGQTTTGAELSQFGVNMYFVFEDNGTGYFVTEGYGDTVVEDCTWTNSTITTQSEVINYTLDNGTLSFVSAGVSMDFQQSNQNPPARPDGVSIGNHNGPTGGGQTDPSGVAEASFEFYNDTYDDLVNVWVSPSANPNWGEPTYGAVTMDGGTFTMAIAAVGGAGSYDIKIVDVDDWVYEIYEVQLTGGMRMVYDTDYSNAYITTIDKNGNTVTYTGTATP